MKNIFVILFLFVISFQTFANEKGDAYKKLEELFNQGTQMSKNSFGGRNTSGNCIFVDRETSSDNLRLADQVPVHLFGIYRGPLFPDRVEAILFVSIYGDFNESREDFEEAFRQHKGRLETSPDLVQYWTEGRNERKITYRSNQNLTMVQTITSPDSSDAKVSYGYCWP